ncbi:MAG TPA: efflux RND transporter permease subunit, partial [Kofleriaceae bacterium]|nr:efflux RND transporter permease subunit [Kofleriaceae bacterium]
RAMPRSEDPFFPTPNFAVIAVYPGASPDQIEREVVDQLEAEIAKLSNIKRVMTRVVSNVAFVRVDFRSGVDTKVKEDELRRQVETARPKLPQGVTQVEVTHFSTGNVAILQLAVMTGETSGAVVSREVERIVRHIKGVRGVLDVVDQAYPDQEARIDLDLARLARNRLSPTQLVGALQGGNASIPGGDVDLGERRFNVQTSGAFTSIADLEDTVVAGSPGNLIRLRDVATARIADAPESYRFRYNGRRAALITITMHEGENIFEVRERLTVAAREAAAGLPDGMALELAYDQSQNVAHRLDGLERDFLIAIVLVLLTLIPLGLRAASLVMISIPMSLAIGVAALSYLGFSLNQLSIVGFVIALGLLVDDSIVVAENIARWLRMGKSPRQAAVEATRQIGVAVLGCTATLVFAFVPLLFLPGDAGQFIRSLPVAVVVTILASLLVSLTLIPFLASYALKAETQHGNLAFRAMSRVIEGAYRPVLGLAMRWRKLTLAASLIAVIGSFMLVPRIGFSVFPKAGIPQVMISIETPDGSSLDYTDQVVKQVELVLHGEPAVRGVLASIGEGHPQVYYNVAPRSQSPTVADVFVLLDHYEEGPTEAMLDRVRARLANIPGAEITLREFQNGPSIEAPIEIRLFGPDLEPLRALARDTAARIAQIPGTRDVRNPLAVTRTDLRVHIDEDKAALLGVQPVDAERAVRMAVSGLKIGEIKTRTGANMDIVLGLPRAPSPGARDPDHPDVHVLDMLEVPGAAGAVPLGQLADLELRPAPRLISHHDRERSVSVTADVALPGAAGQRVIDAALAEVDKIPLPAGYHWQAGGLVESQKETFSGVGPAVIIAMFGVLAILVLEFKSFRATLIVAAVIPLGAMGGLLALFLTGQALSFTASIGFIALIGMEVKNSLLLVDFTNQLRGQGLPLEEAIRRAGEIRFFPILLTSMTAIGGLVPLVLEHSALYSPLALVIIGGLVSSTLLSRLVTPVLSMALLPRGSRLGDLGEAPPAREPA